MATTNTSARLSLVEVAKRVDPNGEAAMIAEVLNEDNEILQDAIWKEANDVFSNRTTRRSQLPAGSWRKLNEGVAIESSKTTQLIDVIGILETRAETDIEVVNAFPDPTQARNDENISFIEGLGQTMAATIIYGNAATTPEKFTGLAPRLDNLNSSAYNVIGEGGSGSDTTSFFVVDWSPGRVFMLFPRNSKVGLEHDDLGIESVADAGGTNKFRAYVDVFTWKAGLCVKDEKCIGRYTNIEASGTTNDFDEDNLIRLINRMRAGGNKKIYCNERMMTAMEIAAKDKANINYTFSMGEGLAGGGPVLRFKGLPVRRVDQILNTETVVA
uniref:Putative capsid protein n=1 Tax=viral metagenome TaxID=1070528 RepID=A0A6M3L6N5_9ZZZZ